MNSDHEAWDAFPQHHLWFNKLHLAERLGYKCGPCGTTPKEKNQYIVRPIYNLGGMGVGTKICTIDPHDFSVVAPGYFWCEYLEGEQYSVTYTYQDSWKPLSCWQAYRPTNNFSKFISWQRRYYYPPLPEFFNELSDVPTINVEFINDKPFEVHLRQSPDPEFDYLYPVWADTTSEEKKWFIDNGFSYIESFDNSNGYLDPPRIGFFVR